MRTLGILEERSDVGVVGFKVTLGTSPLTYAAGIKFLPGMFCWNYRDREGPCDSVSGSVFVVRASVFQEVGGFDPSFFMYYDETDLCARIARLGYVIWYCPGAVAAHYTAAARTRKSPFVLFHMLRNRSLLLAKRSSVPWLAMYLDLLVYYPVDVFVNLGSIVRGRRGLSVALDARRESLRELMRRARGGELGTGTPAVRIMAERLVRRGLRMVWFQVSGVGELGIPRKAGGGSPPSRALDWVRSQENPAGGIRVHSGRAESYPEVTGYLVPTLLKYGDRELATRLVRWLVSIQHPDGSFPSARGVTNLFDTGQVLRGLLAGMGLVPEARGAALRTAEYLCSQMVDGGEGGFGERGYGSFLLQQMMEGVKGGFSPRSYLGYVPESIYLYSLVPLLSAARTFERPDLEAAAKACFEHYRRHKDALHLEDLTHFLGYQLEALIDVGREDLALPILKTLRRMQAADGSVRGQAGEDWVCSPGMAQLAVCWYKVGMWEPADRGLAWLESRQQASGGFRGSYGPLASYFPEVELPWAAKFYLDANLLRVQSYFERSERLFPASISRGDPELKVVLSAVRPGARVLDVGAGKGRFSRGIVSAVPDAECVALDLMRPFLAHAAAPLRAVRASMESLPLADESFDLVFCVEALEHSPNPSAAVREMLRVARPGGTVLIIDKQQSHWGALATPPWEHWPEAEEVRRALGSECENVAIEPIARPDQAGADGLYVAWRGQKRAPMEVLRAAES